MSDTNRLGIDSSSFGQVVFASSPIGMVIFDGDMRLMLCNAAFCRFIGYDETELIGKSLMEYLHPDDRMAFTADQVTYELRYTTKEGRIAWGLTTTGTFGEPGSAFRLSTFQDITNRKQADEALHRSEERFIRAFHTSPDAVIINRLADGVLVEANEGFTQIMGYSRDEVVGRSTLPEDLSIWTDAQDRAAITRELSEHGKVTAFEAKFRRKDGSILTGLLSASLFELDGESCILTVAKDITEMKRIQDELSESESKYRTLVETSPNGIVLLNSEAIVLSCNKRTAELLGFSSASELTGIDAGAFVVSEEREKAELGLESCVSDGTMRDLEVTFVRSDGSSFSGSISASAIRNAIGDVTGYVVIIRDITLQKKMSQDLQQSEREKSLILNATTELIAYYDLDMRVIWTNRAAASSVGATMDELIGRNCYKIWHDRETACDGCPIDMVRTTGIPKSGEVQTPDGRWWHLRAFPVLDDSGTLSALVEFGMDITETREAQRALKESEARYRSYVDNAPIGVFIADRNGRYTEVNSEASVMTGYSAEELTNMGIADLTPSDDSQAGMKGFGQLQERGRHNTESRYRCKDGSIRWWSVSAVKLDDDRYLGFTVDITARRQADEQRTIAINALRERERELSTLLSNLPGISFRSRNHPEWPMEFISVGCLEITGYEPDEFSLSGDLCFNSLIHDADREYVWAEVQKAVGEGRPYQITYRIISKDNSEKWVWEQGRAVQAIDESGKEIVTIEGIIIDITDRKKTEMQNAKLETQLRQAQKMEAIGKLVGGIAHDFNNLLQAMSGYTELAIRRLNNPDMCLQYLCEVASASERATRLVGQLLAFGRRQLLQPGVLGLNDLIHDMNQMLGRIIGEDILLQFIPSESDISLFADRGMLEQVVLNICINARDAMPDGGTLTIETGVSEFNETYCKHNPWASPGKYGWFAITDTGCGIEPEVIDHVFEPFFTTKEAGKGTGLGLSTVYGIVVQHNGMVRVYSEVDRGTVFKVYIPMYQPDDESASTAQNAAKPITETSGTETVILAEDDSVVRAFAKSVLEDAGYTVLAAANGEETLSLFWENQQLVKLLILDVVMPQIGGQEVWKVIQKSDANVPILFCSGYSQNAVHTNFILHAGIRLVQKPYRCEDFLKAVRSTIDEKGKADSSRISLSTAGESIAMSGWPIGLVNELKEAALMGDVNTLSDLVVKIPSEYGELAERLRQYIRTYDYEGILSLLEGSLLENSDGQTFS